MSETTLQEFIERKDYSRIHSSIDIPDLDRDPEALV